ncbi:MAG: tetratricopeptide repeat protein [Heliobacteriaceae bacterium]|jgi:tetratricopeptide (TPR) repeat protein|nr:tetratricopeptide repeat protein [Heliobacteriaceae bacterium]
MKKSVVLLFCLVLLSQPATAGFKEHFDLGQQYLSNYQYSGAVAEFKSALRINYLDNSARIGLVNSYLARGTYFANTDKNYRKAADDYRSALFYLVYYPNANAVRNSGQAIIQVTSNLNRCLTSINFDISAANRFKTAKQLRAEGEFAAAGYEFNQSLSDTAYIKDSFEQVGDIMRLIGNDPKAAEYYKKALTVMPSDLELRMSYAKILDKLGQETDAVQEYNYILSKIVDDKETLYALERIYKKKLETSPTDAVITSNLGAIMQKQGKLDEALRYYSKAEYLDPSNVNTRINAGTLYQQKGDYKTAINAYDSVLILYPDNVLANLYKAQSMAAMGDKKGALERYKKVLALEPDNEAARMQIIDTLNDTMQPAQFTEYVKKNLPGINPAEVMYNYALNLHKQNKLDEAISVYNDTLKLNSTNPEIYINLAIAQAQKKDYDNAAATLTAAGAKFPNDTRIKEELQKLNLTVMDEKLDLAADLYNKGDYKGAVNAYLQVQPATADTMLGVASAYQKLKDNNKAVEYYTKALELRPADSDIAYYAAAVYAEQKKWDEAKTYTAKALTLNKNNKDAQELSKSIAEQEAAAALEKAVNLFEKEKYDESIAILNQIISKNSKNAYALYYRGMIYDTKKDYNKAIADYKNAVAGDAGLVIVNYLIGVDYDNLNQSKNALPYFKKFADTYTEEDDFKAYAIERIKAIK